MTKFRAMLYSISQNGQNIWQHELESDNEDISYMYAKIRDNFEDDITFRSVQDTDYVFIFNKFKMLLGWVNIEKLTEGWNIQMDTSGLYIMIKPSGEIVFTPDLTFTTLFKTFDDANELSQIIMKYAPQRMAYIKSSSIWRPAK